MSKCLVIQVDSSFNNQNLPKYGELTIKFVPANTGKLNMSINSSQYSAFCVNDTTKFTLVGNGYFGSSSGDNYGKEITRNAYTENGNSFYIYSSDGSPLSLVISNKYALCQAFDFTNIGSISSISDVSFLKWYESNIERQLCFGSNPSLKYDIANIANIGAVPIIMLSNDTDIFGDIANLSGAKLATDLYLSYSGISGKLEDLIAGMYNAEKSIATKVRISGTAVTLNDNIVNATVNATVESGTVTLTVSDSTVATYNISTGVWTYV